jgi:hypothetical protein
MTLLVGLPELWWMSLEFYFVNIVIPPWFSMFMYHLGDEQQTRWWLQFRDVVSLPSTFNIDCTLCKYQEYALQSVLLQYGLLKQVSSCHVLNVLWELKGMIQFN